MATIQVRAKFSARKETLLFDPTKRRIHEPYLSHHSLLHVRKLRWQKHPSEIRHIPRGYAMENSANRGCVAIDLHRRDYRAY